MIRHWNELNEKASGHAVGVADSGFLVRSGRSGEFYTVAITDEHETVCSCEWGRWHGSPCSHVAAVNLAVLATNPGAGLPFIPAGFAHA